MKLTGSRIISTLYQKPYDTPYRKTQEKSGDTMEKKTRHLPENEVLQKISDLCEEREWTLYKLAKESHISYSTLNNLFIRNNVPTIPTIQKICYAFQITLSEFFETSTVTYDSLTKEEQLIVDSWKEMSGSDRKLLMSYMCGLMQKKTADRIPD
jgi:transcriptional regulator with XRE-family HTH domain